MKKITLLFLLLLSGIITTLASEVIKLVNSSPTTSELKFTPGNYTLKKVNTPLGEAYTISIEKGIISLESGNPDLPSLTASVIIPNEGEMELIITKSDYYEVENILIAPSKGNIMRDKVPADKPYAFGEVYSQNTFYPTSIASLKTPYILRDYRGQTISVCPFQYNPKTKSLRVYTNIEVAISTKTTSGGANVLNKMNNETIIDKEFNAIYQRQFINYTALTSDLRYAPVSGNGSMLIIAYDAFSASMQPFVEWKNKKGISTELVTKSVAGSSASAIKSYITNYYSTHPNLKYVLLVGDAAQIPAGASIYGDSDNSYGFVSGNDSYPELFVGRFSATNTTHVQTMVNRTLNYEKTPEANGTWYGKGVTIGSDQGPGDNNEYDFEHQRVIRNKLLTYTYSDISENYDGSQGGIDASGNPTASSIESQVNNGVGIITYTGHGADYEFVTSNFSNTEVHTLTNTNKTPFIWSVACVNGDFANNSECFAEAWLRQGTPADPKGAIATLMSTINQSWNPPMKGQDAMVDILIESETGNIQRTFGGISLNGCMEMNDAYQTDGFEMTDTWNLFGDPSVMVYTKTPLPMVVNHIPSTAIGTISITINCNIAGALICLSMNGSILGTGTSDGTSAVITIPAAVAGVIDVTATAFNKMPYFGTITVSGMTTGISSSDLSNIISIYPVPANDELNIALTLSQNSGFKADLYNCLGQHVMKVADESSVNGRYNQTLNIQTLTSGVYLLKIQSGSTNVTKRIVIRH